MNYPELHNDTWTIQTTREYMESVGEAPPGNGPYVTVAITGRGHLAEISARNIVARMNRLAPGTFWAWSGAEIAAERRRRLAHLN